MCVLHMYIPMYIISMKKKYEQFLHYLFLTTVYFAHFLFSSYTDVLPSKGPVRPARPCLPSSAEMRAQRRVNEEMGKKNRWGEGWGKKSSTFSHNLRPMKHGIELVSNAISIGGRVDSCCLGHERCCCCWGAYRWLGLNRVSSFHVICYQGLSTWHKKHLIYRILLVGRASCRLYKFLR